MFKFESYGRNDFDDEIIVRERFWNIRPGDVVVDVGAAIGSYTLPALDAGAAHVFAFCPQLVHAKQLKENLARNEGFVDRCTIFTFGLYDRVGWLVCKGNRYEFQEEKPNPFNTEDIPVHPLDDLALTVDRVDWIKIDVEGAELKVLQAAKKFLTKYKPKALIENHLFMDESLQARVGLYMLELGLGYTMFSTDHNSVSHSLFEVK